MKDQFALHWKYHQSISVVVQCTSTRQMSRFPQICPTIDLPLISRFYTIVHNVASHWSLTNRTHKKIQTAMPYPPGQLRGLLHMYIKNPGAFHTILYICITHSHFRRWTRKKRSKNVTKCDILQGNKCKKSLENSEKWYVAGCDKMTDPNAKKTRKYRNCVSWLRHRFCRVRWQTGQIGHQSDNSPGNDLWKNVFTWVRMRRTLNPVQPENRSSSV